MPIPDEDPFLSPEAVAFLDTVTAEFRLRVLITAQQLAKRDRHDSVSRRHVSDARDIMSCRSPSKFTSWMRRR